MPLVSRLAGIDHADFVDAAGENVATVEAAGDIVPVFAAGAEMDDAAVVLGGHQADRGQGADDAVFGAAEAFEMDAVFGGEFGGLRLASRARAGSAGPRQLTAGGTDSVTHRPGSLPLGHQGTMISRSRRRRS